VLNAMNCAVIDERKRRMEMHTFTSFHFSFSYHVCKQWEYDCNASCLGISRDIGVHKWLNGSYNMWRLSMEE